MPLRFSQFIFVFSLLITLGACNANGKVKEADEVAEYSYLALGDSYTIGEGVAESERWPVILSDQLSETQVSISTVDIIAATGWTTRDLLHAIEEQKPAKYDLVSLLIGVNNQYQGLSFTAFQDEFNILLQTAIDLAHNGEKRVFVVSIPDYGLTPFGESKQVQIAADLDKYNAFMEMTANERNIPFVDITKISRDLGASDGVLAEDKLHPSGLQYSKWVEAILPVAKALISESSIN